jgi:hypothetical protein
MNQRLYGTAALMLLLTGVILAQGTAGTKPKPAASDYPVHAKTAEMDIGVEYMVRSFGADQILLADDFLVVEVAVYPGLRSGVQIDTRKFTLRINGKKQVLFPQSAGMVAASLKYPDWQRKPQMTLGGGMGDRGIILGQPQGQPRFPGDRRTEPRLPAPPQTSTGDSPVEKEPMDINELVQKVALPEGLARFPVSGYLFFPYGGKLKSLKSVELLIEGDSEPLVLRLK